MIHDMVNQKLGKIAITFEKVKKRHRVFSRLSSDLTVVELLAVMLIATKEEHVREFSNLLCDLLARLPGFRLHTLMSDRDAPMSTILYEAHRTLAEGTDRCDMSYEGFWERIQLARA